MLNITNVKVEGADEKWATDPSFSTLSDECYMDALYMVYLPKTSVEVVVEYSFGRGRLVIPDKRVLCTGVADGNTIKLDFDGDDDFKVKLHAEIWYDDDTTDIACSLSANGEALEWHSHEEEQSVYDTWVESQHSLPVQAHRNYTHFVFDVKDSIECRYDALENIYWIYDFKEDYDIVRVVDFTDYAPDSIPKGNEIKQKVEAGTLKLTVISTRKLLYGTSVAFNTGILNYPAMKEYFAAMEDAKYDDLVAFDAADDDFDDYADDEDDDDADDANSAYDDFDDNVYDDLEDNYEDEAYDGVDYFEPIDEYRSLIDDE